MKKNLAKRIVLGLLTGTVLMSSSVALAGVGVYETTSSNGAQYKGSVTVGDSSIAKGADADACTVVGVGAYTGGTATNSVVLGFGSRTDEQRVVSVGYGGDTDSKITLGNGVELTVPNTRRIVNVAKGLSDNDAVNVGQLREALTGAFRDVDAIDYQAYQNEAYDDYAVSVKTLKNVLASVQQQTVNPNDYYTKVDADNTFVKIDKDPNDQSAHTQIDSSVTIKDGSGTDSLSITIDSTGITVGDNSTHIDDDGFYAGGDKPHNYTNAKAAITSDGDIKGASGKFIVDGTTGNLGIGDGTKATFGIEAQTGNVTANGDVYVGGALVVGSNFAVDSASGNVMANDVFANGKSLVATANQVEINKQAIEGKADKATTLAGYGISDAYTKTEVDSLIGGGTAAIAGLNQRLEKTNAKINKVGAGAAALAALHPLDYDPDDKLTFSAGMGNYAGENAAALGAFYRPNEKFMLSLGGTMGNGENMVNIGLSIGLDKASGFAKMSKRELIQEVNAVKAENEAIKADNEAMKDQLENADERIAKLEALVAQLVAK